MSQALLILCGTSDIMDVVSETEDNSSSHSRRGEHLVDQYTHHGEKIYNVYSTGVLEKALTMGTVYIGTTRRNLEPTDSWWRRLLWKMLFNHIETDWPQEDYGDGLEDAHWATAVETAERTYSHIVRGYTLKREIRKSSREKYREETKRAL